MKIEGLNILNTILNGDFSNSASDWNDSEPITLRRVEAPIMSFISKIEDDGTCFGNTNGVDWKIMINDKGEKWFDWYYTGINLTEKGIDDYAPQDIAKIILGSYFDDLTPNIIKVPVRN